MLIYCLIFAQCLCFSPWVYAAMRPYCIPFIVMCAYLFILWFMWQYFYFNVFWLGDMKTFFLYASAKQIYMCEIVDDSLGQQSC